MSGTINSRPQRLTPDLLKICDDIITDILIDHVYYWTTIRKNHDTYTSRGNISSEEITVILQNAIQPMHREERVSKAVSDLTSLASLQGIWRNLNANEQRHFQRHLRMYIKIYMKDCPFEVSSTNQYTSGMHEAAITAREAIKKGAAIKYLCGTRVRLTLEENAKSKEHFSIIQEKKKETSLFLGPARFLNGECKPNAILQRLGLTGMEVRAIRDIQVGEEVTVSYGDSYFVNEDSNYDCRCKTCEEKLQNGFTVNESSTKAELEPSAESSTVHPIRYNTRSKLKRPCETSPENPEIDSLSTAGKRARLAPQLPEDCTGPPIDQPVCRICYGQFPRDETLECPNCRRNLKIYGYQWPQRSGNPYEDAEPQIAAKDNQVFYCTDTTAQGPQGDTESQQKSGRGYDAVDDDYFPTLEELLSSTLRQRDLIKEPKKSQHTAQKGDQRSFQGSSSPIHIAQSKCVNFGDSYEKPIVIDCDNEELVTPDCFGQAEEHEVEILADEAYLAFGL